MKVSISYYEKYVGEALRAAQFYFYKYRFAKKNGEKHHILNTKFEFERWLFVSFIRNIQYQVIGVKHKNRILDKIISETKDDDDYVFGLILNGFKKDYSNIPIKVFLSRTDTNMFWRLVKLARDKKEYGVGVYWNSNLRKQENSKSVEGIYDILC